jgi:hypothetical protein
LHDLEQHSKNNITHIDENLMKKHRLLKQDYSGASKVYGRLTKGFLEGDIFKNLGLNLYNELQSDDEDLSP